MVDHGEETSKYLNLFWESPPFTNDWEETITQKLSDYCLMLGEVTPINVTLLHFWPRGNLVGHASPTPTVDSKKDKIGIVRETTPPSQKSDAYSYTHSVGHPATSSSFCLVVHFFSNKSIPDSPVCLICLV